MPETRRPDFPSCFVFGISKSGTVMLNNIVDEIMKDNDIPVISIGTEMFARGFSFYHVQCDFNDLFKRTGYCYSGFRQVPEYIDQVRVIAEARKVFICRNPFDVMVSRYFSMGYSHQFPDDVSVSFARMASESRSRAVHSQIDEYVKANSWIISSEYYCYRHLVGQSNTKVLRYEDYIYEKKRLVLDIGEWFGLPVHAERAAQIAESQDIVPKTEDRTQHIRQIHPGDAARKLRRETIETLREVFVDYLHRFGYE
jgi:Sulfotransferase domain